MKKLFPSILAAATAALLLSGCVPYVESMDSNTASLAAGGSQSVDDAIPLKVWVSQDNQPLVKELCKEFAESTGKNYNFSYTVVGVANTAATIGRDPDAGADVFPFPSDALATLAGDGLLLPVGNENEVKEANTEASIRAASYQDSLYAYPTSTSTSFLYYDKSKFSEEDVSSVEAMLAKEAGTAVNFAMDMGSGWFTSSFFLANGCTLFGSDGDDATLCDFNNENGVDAGMALLTVASHPKFKSLTDDEIIEGFRTGTLGAAVSGQWNADSIAASLKDNYGCAKLPTVQIGGKDTQLVSFGNFLFYGVNADSAYPEDALALADWLSSRESQRSRLESKNLAPTNLSLAADDALMNPQLPEGEKDDSKKQAARHARQVAAAMTAQGAYQVSQPSLPQMEGFWNALASFGKDMMDGKVTEATLSSSLDQMVEGILEPLGKKDE